MRAWRAGTRAVLVRLLARGRSAAIGLRGKALALFTFLLSAPGHRAHREQVAESLWPEAAPSTAMRKLYGTVHLLRKVLDAPDATGSMVRAAG